MEIVGILSYKLNICTQYAHAEKTGLRALSEVGIADKPAIKRRLFLGVSVD